MRPRTVSLLPNSDANLCEVFSNALNYHFTSEIISKTTYNQPHQSSSQVLHSIPEQTQPNDSANILLVDDEPDTLFTYESILSDEGYNVKSFTDPQEALKHFVQLPNLSSYYKLALLDIRMPKINGLQLYCKIKSLSPKMKIIFCSALDIAQEVTSVLPDIEHEYFIRKPVQRELFIKKINSALNNQ